MRKFSLRRSGALFSLALGAAFSPLAQCQTEPKKEAQAPIIASEIKGMPPRTGPADYQVQAKVGAVTLAADFDGHAVPTLEAAYAAEDYVTVELAFFGGPDARLKLSIEDFSLKINDRKVPYTSQPFGYLARSLKDPEWQPPEQEKEKSKTSINGNGNDSSSAPPPKMPMELRRVMELRVHKSVLPEGDRALPVAGLIFFQYRGKEQNIKSMELVYSGPAGTVSLPLHP